MKRHIVILALFSCIALSIAARAEMRKDIEFAKPRCRCCARCAANQAMK